jgi:hypothetical protein
VNRRKDARCYEGKTGLMVFLPLAVVPTSWEKPKGQTVNYALFRVSTGPSIVWPWDEDQVAALRRAAAKYDNSASVTKNFTVGKGLPRCQVATENYGNYLTITAIELAHENMPPVANLAFSNGTVLKPMKDRKDPVLTMAGTIRDATTHPVTTGSMMTRLIADFNKTVGTCSHLPFLIHYDHLWDPGNPGGVVVEKAVKRAKKKSKK